MENNSKNLVEELYKASNGGRNKVKIDKDGNIKVQKRATMLKN